MDIAAFDPAESRDRMVDGQIRPNQVADPRVLAAMRSVPRERFLPSQLAAFAYVDNTVTLPGGRTLLAPLALARLIQLAQPGGRDRALVVGAGPGYGAAVLAACGPHVVALESEEALLALARAALPDVAPAVQLAVGPLEAGWEAGMPYDIIMIEGAVRSIPPALGAQLSQTGRLVTVLAGAWRVGQAVIATMTPAGLHVRPVFDCATPLIPTLQPPTGFQF